MATWNRSAKGPRLDTVGVGCYLGLQPFHVGPFVKNRLRINIEWRHLVLNIIEQMWMTKYVVPPIKLFKPVAVGAPMQPIVRTSYPVITS